MTEDNTEGSAADCATMKRPDQVREHLTGLTAATTRPTEERRLMPSMSQPPPNCPVCHDPAISWGTHERNGVTEGNYLCANEHGWLTKWVAQ